MKKIIVWALFLFTIGFAAPFKAVAAEVNAPVFEEDEFWEFDLKVSNSSRSNLTNGMYKIVVRNGNLQVLDMENPGPLDGNLPTVPGLIKSPRWFEFPLALGTSRQTSKGTLQISKQLVKKNDCMTVEFYLPVKGPGTITYYYCAEKKSVDFAKAEYPTSILEISLIRHGVERQQ